MCFDRYLCGVVQKQKKDSGSKKNFQKKFKHDILSNFFVTAVSLKKYI